MGGQSSKTSNDDFGFAKDFISYEDASKKDPRLRSFDAKVLEGTKIVGNSLVTCNSDEYFDGSNKYMDFCTELQRCVLRARDSQKHIQAAVTHFEKDIYAKTLEELQKFVEAGNPFTPEFFDLFQSVREQQQSLLEKIRSHKRKLDKKLKKVTIWRAVTYVLFVSLSVFMMISNVVAVAFSASPVVTALVTALGGAVKGMESCCDFWNLYQKALKVEREFVEKIDRATFTRITAMTNVKALAERLTVEIEPLLKKAAGLANREEDFVKLKMDEIKKEMALFKDTCEQLYVQAHKYHSHIIQGRNQILEKINHKTT
ncbi:PREDICTED: UPF0496 protein At2g18630-like isoform X2 [Populus euphratica]|uniref:UPF0496 protein At2g18630-like isoform X2 n=1 Tax=Populus euphratica TaxID=75702 RepID=A0AAJ6U9P9_POPEU|nr:PREDICTED: UPF0496 protein At2g18630-like isoform X2 [Populus euphratica]